MPGLCRLLRGRLALRLGPSRLGHQLLAVPAVGEGDTLGRDGAARTEAAAPAACLAGADSPFAGEP